jgi:hypothetical protein
VSVLEEVVAQAGPDLAGYVASADREPRFQLADPSRAFVLEAVYEGYLMHYGAPRLFDRLDDDLRLLAGDTLYALGLSRLAATGDLEAVAELSDLISRSARAHAEGRADDVEPIWDESARVLSS